MEKPTIKIQYTLLNQLPPLAWVASTMVEDKGLTVIHGKLVETHPEFFFLRRALLHRRPDSRQPTTGTVARWWGARESR